MGSWNTHIEGVPTDVVDVEESEVEGQEGQLWVVQGLEQKEKEAWWHTLFLHGEFVVGAEHDIDA